MRGAKPGTGGIGALPPVSDGAPQPAHWLSENAKAVFATLVGRLQDMGAASATHSEMLSLCAMALDEVETLSLCLQSGTTYQVVDGRGASRTAARPEFAQRAEASRRAAALLAEMGLTLSSRGRAKLAPGSKPAPKGAEGDFSEF
jgi:P27 family predicted phage terminase small subunit